jgi:hypothetical protein
VRTHWFGPLVLATLTASACTHNYRQEFRGQTPLRVRNLTATSVDTIRLVPETRHNQGDNWLASPVPPGGEVTFEIKDGGYWFKAGGGSIDTGNSIHSSFGKLIVVNGATEVVLFDRNTPVAQTENRSSRFAFGLGVGDAPPAPAPATAPAPAPEPAPAPAPSP